jgi:hypothetical protein
MPNWVTTKELLDVFINIPSIGIFAGFKGMTGEQEQSCIEAAYAIMDYCEDRETALMIGGTFSPLTEAMVNYYNDENYEFEFFGIVPQVGIEYAIDFPKSVLIGKEWGDDSGLFTHLVDESWFINGGEICLNEFHLSVNNEKRFVVTGTGRLADELAKNENLYGFNTIFVDVKDVRKFLHG